MCNQYLQQLHYFSHQNEQIVHHLHDTKHTVYLGQCKCNWIPTVSLLITVSINDINGSNTVYLSGQFEDFDIVCVLY